MQKRLLLFILILINTGAIFAQDVTFKTNVPSAVVKGEQFRLTYLLRNASGSDARFPTEIKGIDILYGPSVSQSFSSQNINGKSTSESSESYTFVLMANEEGTYTIPGATIKANGKTYSSTSVTVKVLPPDKTTQSQQGGRNQSGGSTSSSTSTAVNIKPTDAFIRAIPTKTKISEQEAFIVTFRFYTTLNVRDIGKIEFPEFEGFMVEEVDLPVNREMSLEHYNGRNYYAVDLRKSLLFPQRSGKITIPAGKIEMIFNVPSGRKVQSIFGPQEIPVDVKKTMTTSPLAIDVSALPANKPTAFANAVGMFTMDSKISDTKTQANDAITITLTINGTGNLKLIKNPEVKLPKDFETYDPKINNNLKVTANGLSGSRTIEYLFIPRHSGKYTIPPVEFSYYDTKAKSYKTLQTQAYTLDVEKDPNAGNTSAVSYTNQNEIDVIKDIRFLKTDKLSFTSIDKFFFGSTAYLFWYLIPIIFFIVALVVNHNRIKQNSNITLMKTRKANKMATKRLKIADTYLKTQNKEKFYEEVLRAMWGYLSDRLSIPIADLNRENIDQELTKYGVPAVLTDRFRSILDTCEFARYAPAESNQAMDKVYSDTVNIISEMENIIKKKK